jgi:hypothetical protein
MTNGVRRFAPGNLSFVIGHWSFVILRRLADFAEICESA